ncbi:MAG: YoaK family protein [Pseudomonadota bacterium]
MISRLPRWVWLGGAVLASVAGMVNTVSLLGFGHQGISHLTGATTSFSIALSHMSSDVFHPLVLILSFILGAMLSGFLIKDSALHLGRQYGSVLLIESSLLFLSIPLLARGAVLGECLACGACGLQNAMATTYSGAILRTTHVTGMFTDVGMLIGQRLGGVTVDARRLTLCAVVLSGFIAGGAAGAIFFSRWGYRTLLVPAVLTGLAGGIYNSVLLMRNPDHA